MTARRRFPRAELLLLFLLAAALAALPVFSTGIAVELSGEKTRKRNPELSVSWEAVLKMKKEGKDVVFIDTRLETEFKKFHIPNSLNIPLFAVKTKDFLKPADLILINEGYNYSQLEQECLNLRKAGFKAWIFNGGLNYWKEKAGALEGNAFAQEDLNKIPPEAFFLEKNYEGWIMINVDGAHDLDINNLIQGAKNSPNDPFHFILIFNKAGNQYEKIEEAINKNGIANVFYLKGGLDGYEKYLKDKAAIPQTRVSLTPVGISEGKIFNKPCRSCQ